MTDLLFATEARISTEKKSAKKQEDKTFRAFCESVAKKHRATTEFIFSLLQPNSLILLQRN